MFFNFAMAVSLVVVHDLNVGGPRIGPRKTNTPLIIDAYCVLPFAVALQCLKTIRRRHPQIVETSGVIQHSQLTPRRLLNFYRQAPRGVAVPYGFCVFAPETLDHDKL